MRQRKLRNLDQKYEAYADLIVEDPAEMCGRWQALAGEMMHPGETAPEKPLRADGTGLASGKPDADGVLIPLYVEIGCGKGRFISELAEREPSHFFVAVEGNRSVMLRAMEKVRAKGLANAVFVPHHAGDLSDWFEEGEVAGIYLNFSDPQPKNYRYKLRLTYRDRLRSYFRVLGKGGRVVFKTDNTDMFNWSLLEAAAADLKIAEITRDLHADPDLNKDNIETEYEARYSGIGETIKRVIITRRDDRDNKDGKDNKDNKYNKYSKDSKTNAKFNEKESEMSIKSMVAYNGREIPKEDKVFAASGAALDAIEKYGVDNVINATVGALYDDNGELLVLKSVDKVMKSLPPKSFAAYAPIAGTPGFKDAILKAALYGYEPKSYTAVVGTPGGTGSIRNAVANYSEPGDKILAPSWHWAPYKSIANELYRGIERFEMFNEEGGLNIADFEYKVKKLVRNQEHLVIILNTPANNPTGYAITMDEWYEIKRILDEVPMDKKIALVLDVAYIDYAGEPTEVRGFFKVIDNLRANVLPIIAYSSSKTFTFYGARCAAMICLAHSPEVAEEFVKVNSFSCRNTWSNSPRAPQEVIEKIYADPELFKEVEEERAAAREMLLARGRAFEEEAKKCGLDIVPFSAGFFVTIPCAEPDALCAKLQEKNVFLIPLGAGVRVSVASSSEAKCRKLPGIIKETMDELGM